MYCQFVNALKVIWFRSSFKNKKCIITTTTFRAIAEIQKSADLDSYSAAGEEKKSGRRRLKALKKTVLHHMFAFLKM